MKLVPAGPAEAGRLAAIHAAAFEAAWDADQMAALLGGPGVFGFLAEEDGTRLGMILCRVAADEMEVLTVGVAPQGRRRGIAAGLMAAALGWARSAGATAAFLEVAADNIAALQLYGSLGFERAGTRKSYYDRGVAGRMDALVLRLDLTALPA